MMKRRKKGPGRRGYSAAVKAKILAAARRENLTAEQARKRFGISTLTFYRWRVSAGGFHQLSARPSQYVTGAATSSAGSRSSSDATLTET